MRSPIGSLRRAPTGNGVCWLTGARRASPAPTADGATSDRLSANCDGAAGFATNGPRCEPDCRKTALMMMMRLAAAAPRIATESTGRRAILVHIRAAAITTRPVTPAPRSAPRFMRRRLRTICSSDDRRRCGIVGSEELAPHYRQRVLRRQRLAPITKETSCRPAATHDPMHARLCRRAPLCSGSDRVRCRLNEP